jgi:chromatin remodeling complex protein RSC6
MEITPQTETNNEFNMETLEVKLSELNRLVSSIRTQTRALEKRMKKELKTAQKEAGKGRKNKKRSGNSNPSGFTKPTPISDDLATFLGKEKGVEMARTSVTKEINAYVRTHNLQDKVNGRKINPDQPLKTLLQIKDDEELTYFNLQRFMKHHYVSAAVAK